MPIQIVGRSRSINSICIAEGVVVPEPAQLTAMPRLEAARANIWPTGWMPSGNDTCKRPPRRQLVQS